MARLPIYTQQTTADSPRATGQQFGAGVAQAQGERGDALAQVGANIQQRSDVIQQTRLYGQFETDAVSMAEATMTGEDITDPEVVKNYQAALRQKMDETLSEFRGTGTARANLRNQLENAVTQQTKAMMGAQIKAQTELIGRTVEQRFDVLAQRTRDAPSLLLDGLADVDRIVEEFAPGLPKGAEQMHRQAGRSRLSEYAIEGFIERGDLESAEQLMKDPSFRSNLDAEAYRRLRIGVVAERGKVDKEHRKIQRNVALIEGLAGRKLSDKEVAMMPADLPDAASRLAAFEMITGRKVTPDMAEKAFNVGADAGASWFGNSADAKAFQYVQEKGHAFATGMLDPDQAQQYKAAVEWLQRTKYVRDPETGTDVPRRGDVPADVMNYYSAGRQFYGSAPAQPGGGQAGGPMGGSAPEQMSFAQPAPSQGGQLERIPSQPDFVEAESSIRGPTVQDAAPMDQKVPPNVTPGQPAYANEVVATESMPLFDLVPYTTGPKAKLSQFLAFAPGTSAGGVDAAYTTAQRRMNMVRERITNTLRPENRIADQYRQELNALVDVTGRIFDNPERGYRDLAGILTELEKKKSIADKIASGQAGPQYIDQVRHANEVSFLINELLAEFDMPKVRVSSRQEVEALEPGTRFFYGTSYVPMTKAGAQ